MNLRQKFLSIVIPAHNEEKYLPDTLKAIRECIDAACLGNVHMVGQLQKDDFEILIVNDDSQDGTAEIAATNSIRLIDVKLRNIGAVRNAGAKAAQGEWLLFVDADTVVPKKVFLRMLTQMSRGVAGGGAIADIDDRKNVPFIKFVMFAALSIAWQHLGRLAAGCFMFCRRDLFFQFGGFDEEFFAAEELFFTRQVRRRGKFSLINERVLTSSRKLKSYTAGELLMFFLGIFQGGRSMLRSRKGLGILYDGKR